MPQRKQASPPTKKAAAKPGARPAGPPPKRPQGARGPGGGPPRRPGKSIVNQKQTPWALIATVVVLVLFAGAIVAYAVTRHSSSNSNNPYSQPEVAAAKKIPGITWHVELQHTHVPNQNNPNPIVKYDMSPPIGGNHSPYWALCNGVTYNHQIANENAVHMLEHGTVWITYNPKTLKPSDVQYLKTNFVDGVDRMALSPYAGLKTPISLQAWNYQLFVNSAKDPRIPQFIDALKFKTSVTPEPNAGCTGDGFKASQSYPGHPYNGG
jgi:hypothetical protein